MLTDQQIEFRDCRSRNYGGLLFTSIVRPVGFPFYVAGPIKQTEPELRAELLNWQNVEHVIVFINSFDSNLPIAQ